jgi:hypothetical protein
MPTEHNHQDLTVTDITAEGLHMEIERNTGSPTKLQWPNGIPNGIPNHLTGGLPNDYQEANGYSTEAAYRYGRREIDQEVYHEVDQQSLPSRPRFTEILALLESASARRLSLGEKDQGEKMTAKDHRKRSWEKREVNQDIHRVAHRVAHQKAVYQVAHREAVYRDTH